MPDQNGVIEVGDFPGLPGTQAPPGVKDFSFSLEPKKFFIAPDLFLAAPALPLNVMSGVAGISDLSAEGATEKILGFMDMILLDESAARLRVRAASKTEPVDPQRLMNIINWLLEEYGMRPTGPSADSSGTSESADGTTPSTAGASLEG